MLLFFYFCQASQVYRSVMSRAHPLIFSFPPRTPSPEGLNPKEVLVVWFILQKRREKKEEQRFTNSWCYKRKTTFLVLCSIYLLQSIINLARMLERFTDHLHLFSVSGKERGWIDSASEEQFCRRLRLEAFSLLCKKWHLTHTCDSHGGWRCTALPKQFANRVQTSLFLSPKSDLKILLQRSG